MNATIETLMECLGEIAYAIDHGSSDAVHNQIFKLSQMQYENDDKNHISEGSDGE